MARGPTNLATYPIVSSCGIPDIPQYVVVTILDPDVSDEYKYPPTFHGHDPYSSY